MLLILSFTASDKLESIIINHKMDRQTDSHRTLIEF